MAQFWYKKQLTNKIWKQYTTGRVPNKKYVKTNYYGGYKAQFNIKKYAFLQKYECNTNPISLVVWINGKRLIVRKELNIFAIILLNECYGIAFRFYSHFK